MRGSLIHLNLFISVEFCFRFATVFYPRKRFWGLSMAYRLKIPTSWRSGRPSLEISLMELRSSSTRSSQTEKVREKIKNIPVVSHSAIVPYLLFFSEVVASKWTRAASAARNGRSRTRALLLQARTLPSGEFRYFTAECLLASTTQCLCV